VGWNANVVCDERVADKVIGLMGQPQRQPTVATDTIENLFALLLLQVRDKDAEIRELRQQIGDRDVENQQLRQQIGDKNAEIQELKVAAARTTAASSSESVSPFENDSDEEEDTLPVGGSLATSPLRMHWPVSRFNTLLHGIDTALTP
jgi:chromosome segregation ATPase